MTKRIIEILLLIVLCGALFTACKEPKEEPKDAKDCFDYHTEIVVSLSRTMISSDPQHSRLKGSFLKNAKTKSVHYLYVDPKTGDQELRSDKTYPEQLWYIIKDQESVEDFFDDPPEVDFETQMIVLICATEQEAKIGLKKVAFQNNKLVFEFDKELFSNGSWAPRIVQIVYGFRMDRLDGVAEVKAIFK